MVSFSFIMENYKFLFFVLKHIREKLYGAVDREFKSTDNIDFEKSIHRVYDFVCSNITYII